MSRWPLRIAACLVLASAVTMARASSVVVPDDVATIQAALDARVDTVFVRGGGKPESPSCVSR